MVELRARRDTGGGTGGAPPPRWCWIRRPHELLLSQDQRWASLSPASSAVERFCTKAELSVLLSADGTSPDIGAVAGSSSIATLYERSIARKEERARKRFGVRPTIGVLR